ncbi:PAS domain S-box protein [Methanobacterium alcaliphilum]|uniref:PAS domain S-box protein n=1 Tax=Methanobacterium alcaliphilum TaxID=392018 RepID=UPI00200B0A64|nr:PAS domain S-box protein [Methanobacterium alcaliphilum]MCK9152462.1 PAS domain S-box protein [Methanobacterium alcaliphilum]
MSLNILIVEDEAITALDIKKKLEYWGYKVPKIAHTGVDAIKYAENTNPDIILMDIILKGKMDGIETAKAIKRNFDIPVIYLTAHSEDKIMTRAKHTHPYGYLIKPIDEKELHFALDSAIFKHKTEKKLEKSNRALRMISECNQAIVRIKNTDILLNKICRIIVEEGDYKLAWIGMAQDDETKSIKPAAQYGFDDGYLEQLNFSWGENKYGNGPAGRSIRNAEISIFKDLSHNPDFEPWRKLALKRGYNSIVALPLFIEDKIIGSLNIYSPEEDAFDDEELNLLNELSEDISFFLESQKLRDKHDHAVHNLKNSKIRLKNMINTAPFGAHVFKLNNNDKLILKGYNSSADKILGIDHEKFIGKSVEEAFPELISSELPKIYRKTALKWEDSVEDKIEYYSPNIKSIFDIRLVNTGKREVTVFFIDITQVKKAQIALEKSEEKFRLLAENSQDIIYRMSLPEGEYEYISPSSTDIFGYSPQEFYKNPLILNKIIHPEWRQYFQIQWNNLLKGKVPAFYEFEIIDKQGNVKWIHQRNTLIKDLKGQAKYIQGIVSDLTEKKKMEDKLKESERRYRNIFENSDEGIYQSTPEGKYISLNPAFAHMAGYKNPQEMIETVKNIAELYVDPQQREEIKKTLKEKGVLRDYIAQIYQKNGEKIWVSIYAKAIKDEDNILYYEGTTQDITEKKKMEDALKESEEKYRNIVEAANEGIWAMNKNFITTFVNRQMAEILGYEIEEILGKNITFFMLEEELNKHNQRMKNRIRGLPDKYICKFRRKNGDELWAIVSATPLKNKNGEFDGSFAMLTDITPQKEYEEKIKTALKEKELLLSEIHHRVKNNMQIISSLLNLQNSYLNDERDLELFIESQNRVKSMALIHEKLYRSKDLVEIDFGEYIRDLVYYLFYTYIDDPERIKLDFDTDILNLNLETSIPCGIIINELVTNSLKHAFPGKMKGIITTTLKKENNEFILSIKDNGIGFPDNIDFKNMDSLGLRLVINLVDQIDGTISMACNCGTEFRIKFKELIYEKRV